MAHLSVRTINQTWPGAPDSTDSTDKNDFSSPSRQDTGRRSRNQKEFNAKRQKHRRKDLARKLTCCWPALAALRPCSAMSKSCAFSAKFSATMFLSCSTSDILVAAPPRCDFALSIPPPSRPLRRQNHPGQNDGEGTESWRDRIMQGNVRAMVVTGMGNQEDAPRMARITRMETGRKCKMQNEK